tara:strand:+ start:344 stop:1216 length:873 start_codon:yes stop_codon:yes gene_type:complete
MAKIQGIDMAFIKSISTVENTQRWEVTYERDFTIGSLSKDYRSNISEYTIGGTVGTANWTSWSGAALSTANNTNYTSTMAFNGNGMQIAPSTHADYDSTNFWDSWINSPRIMAALDELVPGPSGVPKMVCIQLWAEASRTFAQDYEFFGLCVATQAERDHNNMFAFANAQYNGGLLARSARGDEQTSTSTGTMPTYFELIIYPGANQTRSAIGAWDGEFPAPGGACTLSAYQSNYLACGNLTAANTYIGMTCSTATFSGTATAFTATAKKIRVSVLGAIENATKGITSCV